MPRCSLTALSVLEELMLPPRVPEPRGEATPEAKLMEVHRRWVLDKWLLYNEPETEEKK